MTKCTHRDRVGLAAVTQRSPTGKLLARVCRRCGHPFSLGPSDETRVAVEVRAAELAADWREHVEAFHPWEADGWRGCDPDDATDKVERMSREAGFLAHAIAHHDEEHPQ